MYTCTPCRYKLGHLDQLTRAYPPSVLISTTSSTILLTKRLVGVVRVPPLLGGVWLEACTCLSPFRFTPNSCCFKSSNSSSFLAGSKYSPKTSSISTFSDFSDTVWNTELFCVLARSSQLGLGGSDVLWSLSGAPFSNSNISSCCRLFSE